MHSFDNHGFNCQLCVIEQDKLRSLIHVFECDWAAKDLFTRDLIEEVESRLGIRGTPQQ